MLHNSNHIGLIVCLICTPSIVGSVMPTYITTHNAITCTRLHVRIKLCRLERMSNDSASKMSTLTKENENYKSVVAQKDLELKKYQERYVCMHTYMYMF